MDIFEPISLGSMEIRNRLIMAPVKTAYATTQGTVTPRLIDYYSRRARGGIGAIIVEPCYIDLIGKEHPKQLGITDESHIAGLHDLVDAIHSHGAKAIAHLNHGGSAANPKASGKTPEAPSAVFCAAKGTMPTEMSHERIIEVTRLFARAAEYALRAGFDAIEVQCGLGYLVSQFLSPKTNLRKDEFGCGVEERMGTRFLGDVLAEVRCAVGKSYPVMARISATEQVEGGLTPEDSLRLSHILEDIGVVAIHVASGSACDSPPWYFQHMQLPPNMNLKWATDIQKEINVPVIVAGRMGYPEIMRKAIGENQVAAIALGRPLIADPDLPDKMKAGKDDTIIQCGACLQGCLSRAKSGIGLGCNVNPLVGREKDELIPAPESPQRIVVVGGGPAGMIAAMTAKRIGHEVILFEKNELGGQFNLAPVTPGKESMGLTLNSLRRNVLKLKIDLRIGHTATVPEIIGTEPNLVLLATGAEPIFPRIPGADSLVSGNDILSGTVEAGSRVLIIGGGLVGIECAEYLLKRGRQVTVVEMLGEIARDMEPITKKLTLKRLEKTDIAVLTDTVLTRIDETGRAHIKTDDKEIMLGEFDTYVAAVGTRPVNDLAGELERAGLNVKVIGDAEKVGQIIGATESAFEAVRAYSMQDTAG